MKSVRKIVFFVFFTISFVSVNAGGGWTLQKKEAYVKLSEWWVVSDKHFVSGSLTDPNSTIGIYTSSLYMEYGVSNRFTAVLYAPFFIRSTVNNQVSSVTSEILVPGDAVNALGDFDLGMKYGILQKTKIKLAATLNLGLPMGNEEGGTRGNLQTGDGEFNQKLQLDAGYGFQIGKIPFYSNVYAAINNRTKGFSDEFRFGAEVGAGINKKWWLAGKILGLQSFQNGSLSGENATGIFANNTEFLSYSFSTSYYFSDVLGISGEVTVPISGEVVFASTSYSLGVFLDLKK